MSEQNDAANVFLNRIKNLLEGLDTIQVQSVQDRSFNALKQAAEKIKSLTEENSQGAAYVKYLEDTLSSERNEFVQIIKGLNETIKIKDIQIEEQDDEIEELEEFLEALTSDELEIEEDDEEESSVRDYYEKATQDNSEKMSTNECLVDIDSRLNVLEALHKNSEDKRVFYVDAGGKDVTAEVHEFIERFKRASIDINNFKESSVEDELKPQENIIHGKPQASYSPNWFDENLDEDIVVQIIDTENPKDTIAFHVEVGNLPIKKSRVLLERTAHELKAKFPQNNILVCPMRNGVKHIEIEILPTNFPKD